MNDYPKNWKEISFRIKQQNNFTCERCKTFYGLINSSALHVHHFDNNKANIEDWNLACLCHKCHTEVQNYTRLEDDLMQTKFLFFKLCEPAEWEKLIITFVKLIEKANKR